jgi:hypothetical protein
VEDFEATIIASSVSTESVSRVKAAQLTMLHSLDKAFFLV